MHLFDESAFPWCQGGQLALVSPPGGPPPALEHPLVEAAFEPRRTEKVLGGAENQPFALMRAGPDGDFAHIVVREEQAATLWSRLSESCAEAAVPLRVVDGPTFSRTRWVTADT
ncbi:hypothetical protein D187_006192 [Cystobacter fuscus DSM 2262]|uniref:Uncharacterized protein n=1 Tax=Cystobacter fuscus (strain ATCC 25194 / DSM 2262 / NBRC 100088 / M29) TaxID=1242864 RepID=S9R4G1_CYSF2|nr:hypothetical protein [Cystobacter fuscus]EPX63783.1 hypothetical protein D187_006192 [Cystobacter fuscus DSM 2262]